MKIENFENEIKLSKKLKIEDINNLKKGQKILSQMFKEFNIICRKYKLKYWCVSGTLIGVLRHKGWIPWDNDIDVAMLESDYQKFKKYAKNELSPNLWLQDSDNDRRYKRRGLDCIKKIRHLHSCYIERSLIEDNKTSFNGLSLDIFVYRKEGDMLKFDCQIDKDIKDLAYTDVFPLREKKFDNMKVYIPNKYQQYSVDNWGSYPPRMLSLADRYPSKGKIDPNNTCDFHMNLYPKLNLIKELSIIPITE